MDLVKKEIDYEGVAQQVNVLLKHKAFNFKGHRESLIG